MIRADQSPSRVVARDLATDEGRDAETLLPVSLWVSTEWPEYSTALKRVGIESGLCIVLYLQ
jgi:hypothetical protein